MNPTENNITLKEYFESKISELESQFNIKISALEKATIVAATAMEKRLEGMNEFRDQLRDQTGTFVTRPEYDQQMLRTGDDLKSLSDIKAQFIGRPEHVGMLVKLNEDIRVLRESKANLEGKASQSSVNIAMVVAIIGIVLSLVSIVSRFVALPISSQSPPSIVQPVK